MLLDPSTHTDLLDAFAGVTAERTDVAGSYAAWRTLNTERERRLANARENASRAEFLTFQLAEIDRVAPVAGEDEELAASRQVLANADRLQRLCTEAYDALYEGDAAALPALAIVWKRLADLSAIDPRFTPHLEARDVVKSHLEDLAFFLRSYASGIDASPERLQEIEDRLALLDRLKKKHGPALVDVLEKRRTSSTRTSPTSRRRRSGARRWTSPSRRRGRRTLRRPSCSRPDASRPRRRLPRHWRSRWATSPWLAPAAKSASPPHLRSGVGPAWGRTRGAVHLSKSRRGPPAPGADRFGGELSRIMLALKTLASTDAPGKTLIFDEVDAGIGGAVADVVGGRLQRLAERFQVLCITHLPQIAAHGADALPHCQGCAAGAHADVSGSARCGRTRRKNWRG